MKAARDSEGSSRDVDWDVRDISVGIQDFMICVEMFVAAVAHQYAFPVDEYPQHGSARPVLETVVEVFDLRDVFAELKDRGEEVSERVVGKIGGLAGGGLARLAKGLAGGGLRPGR